MYSIHIVHPVAPAVHDAAGVTATPAVIATTSNVEALAIAITLQDMGATNLTAAEINSAAQVMTQAELDVGYAALLNPAMTAGEVKTEITQLTLGTASFATVFTNSAIAVPLLSDDALVASGAITASIIHTGVSAALTAAFAAGGNAVEALALGAMLIDQGDIHTGSTLATDIVNIASVASQAQLDVAYAQLLNPAMTSGEAKSETVLDTIYPASTTFGQSLIGEVDASSASNAAHLIGVYGVPSAFS